MRHTCEHDDIMQQLPNSSSDEGAAVLLPHDPHDGASMGLCCQAYLEMSRHCGRFIPVSKVPKILVIQWLGGAQLQYTLHVGEK